MEHDLQKASFWKRLSAGIFDGMLTAVLAVGVALLLSLALDYDGHNATLNAAYAKHEADYGVTFDISAEQYEAMTEEEQANYQKAYDALIADEEAMNAYNMVINLMLLMSSVGILAGIVVMEFVVPLLFGNGQTLGKKIFGLCLVRTDGVKLNGLQLFTRTVLGKFTIETMIPVYLILMMFWGIMDVTGTVILCGLGIAQIVIYARSQTNAQIHDLLAGTAVVDIASQRVFRSTDDLIAYQKKIAAERAAQQDY